MQLDIFDDSRDVMLRNDVLSALQQYDAPAACTAVQILASEYPNDGNLADLGMLASVLDGRSSARVSDHDAAMRAYRLLTDDVQPCARRLFGERAGAAWLVPLWRELAQRVAALPFSASQPDAHAAPLYLLADMWTEAGDAVSGIESWRRIPTPLMWMAEARYRLDGLEAAWPLLAELAWLSPIRLDGLMTRLDDRSLNALLRTFNARFDGKGDVSDLEWFPAWILTEKAGLAPLLKRTQLSRDRGPEKALKLMLRLLALEREGRHHELLDSRRELQTLHAGLYAAYMKAR
jgi:hypothetical protein